MHKFVQFTCLTQAVSFHIQGLQLTCIQGLQLTCIQGLEFTCIQGLEFTCIQGLEFTCLTRLRSRSLRLQTAVVGSRLCFTPPPLRLLAVPDFHLLEIDVWSHGAPLSSCAQPTFDMAGDERLVAM